MDELQPGTVLSGQYCVERLVAEGGTSRLYQGHPLHGAGRVAIKQLDAPEAGAVPGEDLAQFQKEFDILQGLDHSGLARALALFEQDGRHYLVEEFVPGATLEAHIQGAGKVPPEEAVLIMEQLLGVLEYLHGHGVIYRDLKPQNVLLQPRPSDDGDEATTPILPYLVRLVDFGAARRWKWDAAADTIALGTPGYAPPEQYGKAQSDTRSDVYGAGALLHYMLTGRPPDPSQGWDFEAPHRLVPGIPRDLGLAVLQAVQVDPETRFQDARAMRRALLKAVGRLQLCQACGAELPLDGNPCPRCPTQSHPTLRQGLPVMEVLITLGVVALLALILMPRYFSARARQQLIGCKSNLKNLGTAMEMYSTDNGGQFPLDRPRSQRWGGGIYPLRLPIGIVPRYLNEMPTCPATGTDTYSKSAWGTCGPDMYTIVCGGIHHLGAGQGLNFPQYTPTQGLISQ